MDLQGLLLTPSDPNSETFVYVSNSHGHILVFRGPTTPRLTSKKAKSFIEKATLFTLAAVTKLSESGFEGDSDERMQIVIFSDIIKYLDLRVFTCPLESEVAQRRWPAK